MSLTGRLGSMLLAAGIEYGVGSGYRGGRLDTPIMRGVDFLLSLPAVFAACSSLGRADHRSV
jgi:ABC-type dipeptide/oligopeptide/nickel transport system permease subunit